MGREETREYIIHTANLGHHKYKLFEEHTTFNKNKKKKTIRTTRTNVKEDRNHEQLNTKHIQTKPPRETPSLPLRADRVCVGSVVPEVVRGAVRGINHEDGFEQLFFREVCRQSPHM